MASTREEYLIYCEMFEKTKMISEKIKQFYDNQNRPLLSDVFVSVANEKERLYFIDFEIGSPYNHIRQTIKEKALFNHYGIKEGKKYVRNY